MQKIHNAATFLVPLLLVFAVLYVIFTAGGTLNFSFLERELWYESRWVEAGAASPVWQRSLYFVIWILPVAFGLFAVFMAMKIALQLRRGILFDHNIGRWLRYAGIGTSGSGLADFLANLITPSILSLSNSEGPLPIQWYFGSEPAGLIVCGGGFYLIGWVMAEAKRLSDENEGFI